MGSTRAALFVFAVGCGGRAERPRGALPDATVPGEDAGIDAGDAEPDRLLIERVLPDHGPAHGGNRVSIVGAGFGGQGGLLVRFGSSAVLPTSLEVADGLIRVLDVPAGLGVVDVRVERAASTAILLDGYRYEAFQVEPDQGPVEGGGHVDLRGAATAWDDAAEVTFDGAAAACALRSARHLECTTPPGELGGADVRVVDGSGGGRYDQIELDAYQYVEAFVAERGLFSGGPIDGEIVVTVVGDGMQSPLRGVFVMLGVDPDGPYQGETDDEGRITFVGDDLVGPQTVTAASREQRTMIVDFDSREVRVEVEDYFHGDPGPVPMMEGALIDPFALVPEPIGDEERGCWVAPTDASPFTSRSAWAYVPDGPEVHDARPYALASYPRICAVWAVCGIATGSPPVIDAWAMGVRRGLPIGSYDAPESVDFAIDIPLDRAIGGRLGDAPTDFSDGPVRYEDAVLIDLGEDGFIVRPDRARGSADPLADFFFAAQPVLDGPLSDASFTFVGLAFEEDELYYPYSRVTRPDVLETDSPIVVDGFLDVPVVEDPAQGVLFSDRTLSWRASGEGASYHRAILYGDTGWEIFASPSSTRCTLPDVAAIAGLADDGPADGTASVVRVRVPGVSWGMLSYSETRTPDAYAGDAIEIAWP